MTRLANRGEAVICRVKTKSGSEVIGAFARAGYADWDAVGRGLLLDIEVIRDASGQLQPLPSSQGVFIPGDEIALLSVVELPEGALPFEQDE